MSSPPHSNLVPGGFNLSALGSSSFSTPPAETPDSPPCFNSSSSFSLPSDAPKLSLNSKSQTPNVQLSPPPAPPPSPPPPTITIMPSSPPKSMLSSLGSSSFSTPQSKPPPPITSSSSFSNPIGFPVDVSPGRSSEIFYQTSPPLHVFPSPPPPPPPSPSLIIGEPSPPPSP